MLLANRHTCQMVSMQLFEHLFSVLVLSSEQFEGTGMGWEGSVGEELKVIGGAKVTGSMVSRALSHCGEA